MTNILFIASFPIEPKKGGVQRVTHILTEEFLKRGAKVFYLSLGKMDADFKFNTEQFVLPNTNQLWSGENISFSKNLIKEKKIEVIINQTGVYKAKMNFVYEIKPKGVRLITVHHNCLIGLNKNYRNIRLGNTNTKSIFNAIDFRLVWEVLKFLNKKKQAKLLKNAIDKSDKLALLSESYIKELEYYLTYFDESKIVAMPNPASFETNENISFDEKENRIVYVGRLSITQKRVEKLLLLWEGIYQKYPSWQFDILGDGPAKQFLLDEIKKRGLKRITIHGTQDPKLFLAKAKLFVMTSDFEGFPMVLPEAQSYGVVPVAFNTFGAISDVIQHQETGLVIKEEDIQSYIMSLQELMSDQEKLKAMSAKVQKMPSKYKVRHIADNWIKLINDLN
ncbi:glycosyltransferase [Mangrovimonas aestuarii]|uniref:glycosyltransferase n=1 Tax=Mangrovimonas aestuarii TaxID=3018443 RepID=UPI0023795A1D|nr:glycosyltransferase [Mangrovimonas aestuarii]